MPVNHRDQSWPFIRQLDVWTVVEMGWLDAYDNCKWGTNLRSGMFLYLKRFRTLLLSLETTEKSHNPYNSKEWIMLNWRQLEQVLNLFIMIFLPVLPNVLESQKKCKPVLQMLKYEPPIPWLSWKKILSSTCSAERNSFPINYVLIARESCITWRGNIPKT